MPSLTHNLLWLGFAGLLIAANAFFVAAEFALVKIRPGQVDEMVARQRPFAPVARWLFERLDAALSACQLGITMASLGLGWVGEPAFANLVEPALHALGITSPVVLHSVSFTLAFTLITVLHIVIGEQVPKIYAIRKPEGILLGAAWPMRAFYYATYPLMAALNRASTFVLARLGVGGGGGHDEEHSEAEIRTMLRRAHERGDVSRVEHRLLDAVFEFDDRVARQIMVPRSEVVFLDAEAPFEHWLEVLKATRHTRYPVCEGSLDHVVGMVHVKDLLGASGEPSFDWRSVRREPYRIPETMPIAKLLRGFQSGRQHMALVVDEYGNTIGTVSLENVLEQLVGAVEDEFDDETPDVIEEAPGRYLLRGVLPLDVVNRRLGLELYAEDVDTLSGYLVQQVGGLLEPGQTISLPDCTVEVLDAIDGRALRVRLSLIAADQRPG